MSVKYQESLAELMQFLQNAGQLKSDLHNIITLGLNRLDFGIKEWKNLDQKPSFAYSGTNPSYPYAEKNFYINAPTNLWYRTMWSFLPALDEVYFDALLERVKRFENPTYKFNKGMVYGNLGVSQAAQMKLDEGFANILIALMEDSIYSGAGNPAPTRLFRRNLFTQFEDKFVKKDLENYLTKTNMTIPTSLRQFVEDFLTSLDNDQRVFFDYTFARAMQNWKIWTDKENAFTANRLLSCTQDICLFAEDLLKSKINSVTLQTRPYWVLNSLIPLRNEFSGVSLRGCGAKTMSELDTKLSRYLGLQNQPEKCLKILTLIRNYSSHNVKSGTSQNVFYDKYVEIITELVRAISRIKLLP